MKQHGFSWADHLANMTMLLPSHHHHRLLGTIHPPPSHHPSIILCLWRILGLTTDKSSTIIILANLLQKPTKTIKQQLACNHKKQSKGQQRNTKEAASSKYIYIYICRYMYKHCQAQPSSHNHPKAHRAEELGVSSLGIILTPS